MFSSELSWAPVTEVGSRTESTDDRAPFFKPPPPEPASTREAPPTGRSRSVKSSHGVPNPSVFRWGKGKTSRTLSSTHHQQRWQAKSSSGSGLGPGSGSGVWISTESTVEMPEERGLALRHELPASSLFTASGQVRFPSLNSPTASCPPTLSRSSSRYHCPSSGYESEGCPSRPQTLEMAESQKGSNGERWRSLWRPPEEWASSSKGPISNSDYLDSSPQTTIVSLSRSQSSVLDGLSPPPKSPGIHRPSMADFPPSPPAAAATAATSAVDTPSWSGLQALVRRMPSASAATRWNRATEEWPGPLEACERDEIELEKQLWLLAELHRRDGAAPPAAARLSVPPASPAGWTSPPVHAVQRPGGGSGRVLDVCSRQADLVQLAALQPGARIAHLAPTNITSRDSGGAEAASPLPLPPNVASLSLLSSSPQDPPAFPLGDATLDHARVTPAAVGAFSGPQLMALLRECYRVLAVRGRLEVRMVDPAPCGGDGGVGPATARWVEAELLLALEARFRCTRPAALVPVWAREAGLELMTEGGGSAGCDHEFRVCVAEGAPPEERLEAELVRALLRSQYPFVKTWLWEVEECRAECLERATKFRVVSVFGLKA